MNIKAQTHTTSRFLSTTATGRPERFTHAAWGATVVGGVQLQQQLPLPACRGNHDRVICFRQSVNLLATS